MGLVILIAEEDDGAALALGLGLLLQLATGPITKREKTRWGRRGIRMSLKRYGFESVGIVPIALGDASSVIYDPELRHDHPFVTDRDRR